ncbi:MAG: hypothetical protein A4E68_00326 [Syntrophaceae bacterium PtaB.Bin095]|jgi:hypothetical protein|nr:MAG: hypothetical protein A4E68_00326 [Syntrophaceae bacterium PtaB.Bin095]
MKKSGLFLLAMILISAPLASLAASNPTHKSLLFVDDYQERLYDRPEITDLFRSPTIGPPESAAWYEGCESATAMLVSRMDGMAVEVNVPEGCHLDYIGNLGQAVGNKVFLLSWDIEIKAVNGGGGMFFVRFPRNDDGMQVLFGFLDDGRVIRFDGNPSLATLVHVGTFQQETRYRVFFLWNLVAKTYSVFFDGAWIIDGEPIPGHFKVDTIENFGFDINQSIAEQAGLPPALGNIYYVDNIKFGPFREKPCSLPQLMLLLGN